MSTIKINIVAAHATEFWNKEVPLKVRLFVWCLFRNRLPTMDNLIKRQVLQPNAQLCTGGCGKMEDADHLFLSSDFFLKFWYNISN